MLIVNKMDERATVSIDTIDSLEVLVIEPGQQRNLVVGPYDRITVVIDGKDGSGNG